MNSVPVSTRRVAVAAVGAALFVAGCGPAAADPGELVAAEQAAQTQLPPPLAASRGAKRYVSASGSDRAPGTASSPWRTIQKALDALRPGQTAIVRAGRYRQSLVMARSGRRSAPITVRGERGAIVAAGSGKDDDIPLTIVEGAGYLRFRGLIFEGATGPSTANVYASHGAHDIELSRCEVRGSQRQGFFSEASTRRIQILGCKFHDNGGSGPDGEDHNVYIEGERHLVAGNLMRGARNGFGIQVYPSSDHTIIAGNTITGNEAAGVVLGSDGDTTTRNALVVNNIVTASRGGVATYWGGRVGTGNVVRDNLGWDNARGGFRGRGATWAANLTADPRFAAAARGDYHLGAGSPAIDRALKGLALGVDLDGRARPRGDGPDLGAYER